MRFSQNIRFSAITALLVCTLEVLSVLGLQNDASSKVTSDVSEYQHNTKNTTINNFNNSSGSKTLDLINSGGPSTATNVTAPRKKGITKRLKRRRKNRKFKIQHRALALTTSESSLLQSASNQTDPKPNIKKKRRRKLRKRKNRKNRRRQQKLENSNILEVTTAKGIIFSTNTNSNSTINELIRKLNENPEDNFEEFRLMHSSKNNTNRDTLANLVAPVPATSKFTTTLHNNITLHISIGNDTTYKTPIKRNNRCRKNKGGCAHICNPKGKIKCSCLKGFSLAADQKTCLDIDECKINNGGCEKECRNTLGTYECRCPNGLRLADDFKSCEDVNECLLRNGHGRCQDTCENVFGSYKCSCTGLNGTVLGDDGHTCVDLDECISDNGGCSHTCINAFGKAFCSCPNGMELSSDWRTCQDINECEDDEIKISCPNCVNTEGSFQCVDPSDYQDDQPSVKATCKPLPLPPVGYITCSRDSALRSYAKTGRERITNSPGTSCKLVCPDGFRMIGHYYVTCGSLGKWKGKTGAKCTRVQPPILLCPPTQVFRIGKKSKKAMVNFPSPETNINWKYVKSYPSWGKKLTGLLKVGHYTINFIARDPNSKLSASCTFKIVVED